MTKPIKFTAAALAAIFLLGGAAVAGAGLFDQEANAPDPDQKGGPLQPTETCPREETAEVERVRNFVHGRTWTNGRDLAWGGSIDMVNCAYIMKTNELTEAEKRRLKKEGGKYFELIEESPPRRLPGTYDEPPSKGNFVGE